MAVTVIDTLEPKNAGTFPIARADQLLGGFMQVADNTARDAIPAARRSEGMRVHVQASGLVYRLAANLTTWIGPGDAPRFKNALTAQSNSETSTFPTSVNFAIGERNTFIRTAVADHDSVRMWEAGVDAGYPTLDAGLDGRVTNLTEFIVDLYPIDSQVITFNGSTLAADEPLEISPGSTIFWCVDDDGVTHITT